MKKLFFLISLISVLCGNAFAQVQSYKKLLEVDLNEKIPPLKELEAKYLDENSDYDKRYKYQWSIGNIFDEVFKTTIVNYGSGSQRVPAVNEKMLEKLLGMIPPEYYQYIGPYLHTVPGIPEKILNMPGIKETKNKFPTRVAKEMSDVNDLEFLSPYLYFLLMPEVWPSYVETREYPLSTEVSVKGEAKYDPEFMKKIRKLVPAENYYPGAVVKKPLKSELRTIDPTATSPLTAADVRAFASTLQDVKAFGAKDYNILKIYHAGSMIDAWEADNGKALPINALKGVVNPCKRIAQKVRLAGLENEFVGVVASKGFSLNGWAYTCDKTLKAYRVAVMNIGVATTIANYQRGYYNDAASYVDYDAAQQQYAVMQALAEMYRAPTEDVMEVRKEKDIIYRELLNNKELLIDTPIVINY